MKTRDLINELRALENSAELRRDPELLLSEVGAEAIVPTVRIGGKRRPTMGPAGLVSSPGRYVSACRFDGEAPLDDGLLSGSIFRFGSDDRSLEWL